MPRFKHKKPYGLRIRVDFGKHKGKLIRDIIEEDPDYIAWCLDNIDGFVLDEDAQKEFDVA
jgi:hypothetical protein